MQKTKLTKIDWAKRLDHIEWPYEPVKETTDISFWWVWESLCNRYRVVRSIPKYDPNERRFIAGYGKLEVITNDHRTLESAMLSCQRHLSKVLDKEITSNRNSILANTKELAFIPTLLEFPLANPINEYTEPILPRNNLKIIPNNGNKEFCKANPGLIKGVKLPKPGIAKKVGNILSKASRKNPISLEDILTIIRKKYPDREMEDIVTQVCNKEKSKLIRNGTVIKGNKLIGFWSEN